MTYINQDQHICQEAAPSLLLLCLMAQKRCICIKVYRENSKWKKKPKGWQPVKVNDCLSRKCHGRWEQNPPTVTDNIWSVILQWESKAETQKTKTPAHNGEEAVWEEEDKHGCFERWRQSRGVEDTDRLTPHGPLLVTVAVDVYSLSLNLTHTF